ncbi:MAG: hypothetical protein DSZ06_01855 [Sulfurospirillum sp.]|nr:MAG: hypothetical protein DSZ06_01855 [Sulfurospirillum sp.]
MGIKKYIGFSLLFIILTGLFVYSFEGSKYTLNILDIPITLPVAVWIVIPLFLLAIATILHLMFYGTKNAIALRRIKKDSQKFAQEAKEAMLGKDVDANYKSEVFKLPGAILPLLNSDPNKAKKHRIHNDEIQDIIDLKEQIDRGEVVDLSPYNLSPSNPYMLKNYRNRLDKDPEFAKNVLGKCDDEETCKLAFEKFVTFGSYDDIVKFEKTPSKKTLFTMLERIGTNNNPLELTNSQIIDYMKKVDDIDPWVSDEIIKVMKIVKTKLSPDQLVLLANKLAHDFPYRGGEAYLYTMFDLQKISDAREFLDNAAEDEYPKFRYLLFLKDQGRNFDTELFV